MPGIRELLVVLIFALSGFLGGCTGSNPGVNSTRSVFLNGENLIRLTHESKDELVIQRGIDTDIFGPILPRQGLGYATPTLLWITKSRAGCPGNAQGSVACGSIPPAPPGTGEWDRCEIYSDPDGIRQTPGNKDVPGFPIKSAFKSYCYFAVSANSTHSVIAASITAWSNNSDTVINGELIIRDQDRWRSPNYPGKSPEATVHDTAVNNQGTLVGYTMRSKARLLDVANDQVTDCIDGRQIAFGKINNESAIVTADDNNLRFALVGDCDAVTRSRTVPGAGARIISLDWNEFSGKVVYIKQVGNDYGVFEYSFRDDRHTEIISDSRVKTSISILRS